MREQLLENWAKSAHEEGAGRSELAVALGVSKQAALGEIQ
jgi:hypothetical protein